jgi:hypothetical protein
MDGAIGFPIFPLSTEMLMNGGANLKGKEVKICKRRKNMPSPYWKRFPCLKTLL